MNPVWKQRLIFLAAAVLAAGAGMDIAAGAWVRPVLSVVVIGLLALVRFQPWPPAAVLLGLTLLGYLVGNRGFAQLAVPLGGLPLLPAEAALLGVGALVVAAAVARRELPVRREALNMLLLGWMLVGAARLGFDGRTHGFAAVRDSATVYYAAFFYLAQEAGATPAGRQFLRGCLRGGCVALLVLWPLTQMFPDFFWSTLTVRQVPIVYYKADLAGTFMAVGAVLFFLRFETRGRWWELVLSLALMAGTLASNNRASMLGLLAAAGWLLAARRLRMAVTLTAVGAVGAAAIFIWAWGTETPLERTPVYSLYERVVSLADPQGARTYVSADAANKGDNNQFRLVWWRTVLDETVHDGPWLGLGFGHDLADRFVREYQTEDAEEFTTRSPHNVLLTVFARMGAVGLVAFLAVLAVVALRTWRALRQREAWAEAAAPWCSAWVILVSACFGVVLEGPMGAVVFWTLLGLGSATAAVAAAEEIPATRPQPGESAGTKNG